MTKINKFNVIFLDVDGVLNNKFSMLSGPSVLLDPATVERFRVFSRSGILEIQVRTPLFRRSNNP